MIVSDEDIVRLRHMLDAIAKIGEFVDDGSRDEKTQNAVIRQIEIIGEASRHVSVELRTAIPDIPWGKMIGMRNILIHQYEGVDADEVWRTVDHELPTLKRQIERILGAKDTDRDGLIAGGV